MSSTKITSIILGMTISLSIYANTPSLNNLLKLIEHQKHTTPQINKKNTKYTDFSGHWTGTCESNHNDIVSESLDISNDDYTVKINDKEYFVGVLMTQGSSAKIYGVFNDQHKLTWDKPKKALTLSGIRLYSWDNTPKDTEESLLYTLYRTQFKLEGNILKTNTQIRAFDNIDKESTIQQNCTYSKNEYYAF